MFRKAWTIEEDTILISLYPTGGVDAIRQKINRSANSIWKRANRLGLIIPYDVHWLCKKHHDEVHRHMEATA